jgi:hypothetical protein
MNKNTNFQAVSIKTPCAPRLLSGLLAVFLGLSAFLVQAEEYRYRYTPLDQIKLPAGAHKFIPRGLTNDGRVYGFVCANILCNNSRIASYKNGQFTFTGITDADWIWVSPNGGTLATEKSYPVTGVSESILFYGSKVEHIPPQQESPYIRILTVNDQHAAFLESGTDLASVNNHVYYRNGLATVIDFGPTIIRPIFFISFALAANFLNNEGIIAGTTTDEEGSGARGFRYDTKTGKAMILQPFRGDNSSWGLGINNRGFVVGFSILSDNDFRNIGVWDRKGHFFKYLTEDLNSFGGYLILNDNNVIVITQVGNDGNDTSYLVPKPGVRLDIEKLVVNLPTGVKLSYIGTINNRGDMFGYDANNKPFLLKRL